MGLSAATLCMALVAAAGGGLLGHSAVSLGLLQDGPSFALERWSGWVSVLPAQIAATAFAAGIVR